jgi:hypothetical protein
MIGGSGYGVGGYGVDVGRGGRAVGIAVGTGGSSVAVAVSVGAGVAVGGCAAIMRNGAETR